jgi:dihydrofolate synthase / folylpolyglutamate synthase
MMSSSYRETISWLFSLQKFGIKLGLSSITRLLELLGNPHHSLHCIHIAGTNGKGSTAAYLHAIYCRAGYRPGLYTSPHLVDFSERIVINDRPIAHGSVISLVQRLRTLCRRNGLDHITFFEFTTALALTYFAQHEADPVILETGLGGRLDATNIVDPLLSIITSISREHTAHLGPTLMHITREKAGIIKKGRPCISAVTRSGPRDYIRQVCQDKGTLLMEYSRDFTMRMHSTGYCYLGQECRYPGLSLGLIGQHQVRNAAVAITAVELLRTRGYTLQDKDIHAGVQSCRWPGRLEVVQTSPRHIVLDGAHNPAAWQVLARALKHEFSYRRLVLIIGVMRDKDIRSLLCLVALAHTCIFFKPKMERSAGREYLEKYIVFSKEKRLLWYETLAQSLATAHNNTGSQDLICITGSLFAVGEARELLRSCTKDLSGRIGL